MVAAKGVDGASNDNIKMRYTQPNVLLKTTLLFLSKPEMGGLKCLRQDFFLNACAAVCGISKGTRYMMRANLHLRITSFVFN